MPSAVKHETSKQETESSVTDYFAGLAWDGTPRLDRWLIDCARAEDNAYVRAASRLTLVAAVRMRSPGCKFDEMPLLAGPPGSGKSRALRLLAVKDSWFTDDLPLGWNKQQQFRAATTGRWIVAARKMQSLKRAAAMHFKAILSRTRDPHHLNAEVPRQFVIIGTTNVTNDPLGNATGNRRFWPINVQRFDLEHLRAVRDQLWAEAAEVEALGQTLRLDPGLYDAVH